MASATEAGPSTTCTSFLVSELVVVSVLASASAKALDTILISGPVSLENLRKISQIPRKQLLFRYDQFIMFHVAFFILPFVSFA